MRARVGSSAKQMQPLNSAQKLSLQTHQNAVNSIILTNVKYLQHIYVANNCDQFSSR